MIRAVEFFSGIGAFSQAARDLDIEVVAAFDQNAAANDTFALNYRLSPRSKNLDSISAADIPASDLWWMSPPCTPYTVRGKQSDIADPRAKSLVQLISTIPQIGPETILIENVRGFYQSRVHILLDKTLKDSGYQTAQLELCSTEFGVPMRRPRYYIIATKRAIKIEKPIQPEKIPLSDFLKSDDESLNLNQSTVTRYGGGFDIVEPGDPEAELICFTKGYGRCMKASGSMLRLPGGALRRVSPEEILSLLGFADDFVFPSQLDFQARWRLLGNSVDVRAIRHILCSIN